jgi:hypothetical protein
MVASDLSLMTELEAVNILLSVIGEAPIDQLSTTSANELTESAVARRTLGEVSRDVQSEGFSWNTDRDVKLVRNASNQFTLPSNQLRASFDPTRYPSFQLTARGNRIYDRDKQSFTFTETELTVSQLVTQLVWDDLPHQAQQYIAIRASRIFAGRFVNSNAIYAYTTQDEEYARAMLMRDEESGPRHNWLSGGEGLAVSPYQPAAGLVGRY